MLILSSIFNSPKIFKASSEILKAAGGMENFLSSYFSFFFAEI